MTTVFYSGGATYTRGINNVLEETFLIGDKPLTEQITDILKRVTFGVQSALDGNKSIPFSQIKPEFGFKNEGEIRDFIKDHQISFSILEKSIPEAIKECKQGKKTSLEIYINDINNSDIVELFQDIKKSGINPGLLILDIKKDDYGLLNSVTIANLRLISELGFTFSIDDFRIDKDSIIAPNMEKLLDEKIYPSYIKIAKDIFEHITSNNASKKVKNLLRKIRDIGIKILINTSKTINKVTKPIREVPDFLKHAEIKNEDILSIDGELHGKEGLINFGNGVSTPDGLSRLKGQNQTLELLRFVTQKSVDEVLRGQRRSINVYLKDLGNPNFEMYIKDLSRAIKESDRKYLIFEILEDTYGSINREVIKNLKLLQELGFSLAIDDLYLGSDKNSMSREIFETVYEEGIMVDYLKIDGRHAMGIRNGTITTLELRYLREIIGQFAKLKQGKFHVTIEWIQNIEHARQIIETLNLPGISFLFQGRNISYGNFQD